MPIQRNTNQISLDELAKRSLFTIESDQYVVRPINKIFEKKQNVSNLLSLSPSKEKESSPQSLKQLFLTQGLTRKASSIKAIEPYKDFKPMKIEEKFISPDKELVKNNNIIKTEHISELLPNINSVLESTFSIIPITIKNKIKSEIDDFPDLPLESISLNSEKRIQKQFNGYDPEIIPVTKTSCEKKTGYFDTSILKVNAIKRLNLFLNRIQERAY